MKKVLFIISIAFLLLFSSFTLFADPVKSLLGIPYGEICSIRAVFVEKPDTYYARNISNAGFYLKIIAINGQKLDEPLIVEPEYKTLKIKKDVAYLLKAYEAIESWGEPVEWSTEQRQFNYQILHKIVVKFP